MLSRSNDEDKCPYLNSPDCGHPDKNPLKWCALYKHCTSYKSLKETERASKQYVIDEESKEFIEEELERME